MEKVGIGLRVTVIRHCVSRLCLTCFILVATFTTQSSQLMCIHILTIDIACPGGDRIVCPDDQACFASTPCTLVPTSVPSTYPSAMPTDNPTRRPTRAPWSESQFLEFINSGIDDSASGGGNTDGKVSAEVIDALEDSTNLQCKLYSFLCRFE